MSNPFANYENVILLLEGPYALFYRAQHQQSGQQVLIKLFKANSTLEDLASLQALPKVENYPNIILQPIEILYVDQHLGFAYPDQDFSFLREYMTGESLPLVQLLLLGKLLAEKLFLLHQRNLLHQDLTPGNVLIQGDFEDVRLIGYQGFQDLHKRLSRAGSSEDLFYTYTAPELLGEQSAGPSPQSDLYALGVILYELVAKAPPFSEIDPLQRLRHRQQQAPKPLSQVVPETPKVFSRILEKLLHPDPKARYKSAKRLAEDFGRILREVQMGLSITSFEPEADSSHRNFLIPNKVYGAEANLEILRKSWENVRNGGIEVCLIKGRAGMGKSTMINQLKPAVEAAKGLFIEVRLRSLHRSTPYYLLQRGFQYLILQLISQDELQLKTLRKTMLKNLGNNAQVLIDFVPELEFLLGPQKKVPQLDSAETQKRFIYVCTRFLQSLAVHATPIIFFFDNFHWADQGSIQLLQALATSAETRYLFLILSYREEGILQENSFNLMIRAFEKANLSLNQLTVKSLELEQVIQMLQDSMGVEQDFEGLAKLLLQKTEGNPFFLKQLLQSLYEKDLFRFDENKHIWSWDINKIHDAAQTESVLDLMNEKIKTLPKENQELLRLASTLGMRFNLRTLGWITERSKSELFEQLKPSLDAGLIVEELNFRDPQDPNNQCFHFLHSRILSAAYSAQTAENKKRNHLRIGQVLLEHLSEEPPEDEFYALVNHLNQGIQFVTSAKEKNHIALLNLRAGDMARNSAAYDSAWRYYSTGINLLSPNSWETDYQITRDLYLRFAESEYYSGNLETPESVFLVLEEKLHTMAEKLEVILIKVRLMIRAGRYQEAMNLGLETLKSQFGEPLPPNDAEIAILADIMMQELSQSLSPAEIENLQYLSEMTDPQKRELIHFISQFIPAVYMIKPALWVVLTLKMVQISKEQGNTPLSAYAYMNYAVLLCSGMKDFQSGFAMAKLALNINRKFGNQNLEARLHFLFGSFISHWEMPAQESLRALETAYQAGLSSGDLGTSASAVQYYLAYLPFSGKPLEEISQTLAGFKDFANQINSIDLNHMLSIAELYSLLVQPSKQETPQERLQESNGWLESLQNQPDPSPLRWFYVTQAVLLFHFGEEKAALKRIEEARTLDIRYSQLTEADLLLYHGLILLALYPHMSFEEKRRSWATIKACQEELKHLAETCEINFRHKYLLLSAGVAGQSGNILEAIHLFDQSIALSEKNGFTQDHGLAAELAGRYFLEKQKETIAKAYFQDARLAYLKWGATAKVIYLEQRFPSLALGKHQGLEGTPSEQNFQHMVGPGFDLSVLGQAFLAMQLESDPSKIFCNFLKLGLEMSGAAIGSFLLAENGRLHIFAKANLIKNPQPKPQKILFEEDHQISHNVINYVQKTHKPFLLNDVTEENTTGFDPYLVKFRPKSLYAQPILYRGSFLGILYLENRLSTNSFTPTVITQLESLSQMVAIALENSILYSNLARTTESLGKQKQALEKRIRELEKSSDTSPDLKSSEQEGEKGKGK